MTLAAPVQALPTPLAGACGLSALVLACSVHAAEPIVPIGAKATLSVDYLYESAGSKRSEGMYDPHEWRVRRSVKLTADLAAHAATAMPTVQAIDAAQMGELKGLGAKSQGVADKMAPMMADVQKMMARCGDDEACLTREAQKLGMAMQGTPQMAAAMGAKKDIQELSKPGAPRYQAWRPTLQKGTYLIDETAYLSIPDPICASRPRHRCTRNEVRKGSGDLQLPAGARKDPAATSGYSAVEVDAVRNTLTVMLPVPLFPLPYTETITTDEPAGTHDTPTPKGPQHKQHQFRVNAAGAGMHDKPFTVPLRGGWRSQWGEQVATLKGAFGNAGKLTIRWSFNVQ